VPQSFAQEGCGLFELNDSVGARDFGCQIFSRGSATVFSARGERARTRRIRSFASLTSILPRASTCASV